MIVAGLAAVGCLGMGQAQAACIGGRSLTGYYGLLVGGNSLTPNSTQGKYLSGAVRFDGKCGLFGANLTGGIDGAVGTASVTGNYGQNSDGTVTVTLHLSDGSPAQNYIVGVSQSTTAAVGIETDGSATATIHLAPQRNNAPAYTNASLAGRFAVVCSGEAAYKDDLNYVTFDGQGNLSGQNPFNVNGFIGNAPYVGTYTVTPDGTFQGVLLGSYSQFTFNGVIASRFAEVDYTYVQAGVGEIVACSGMR
jgi:hypothetical protein